MMALLMYFTVPHISEVLVHLAPLGEVAHHPHHEALEAGVGEGLIIKDDQEGRHEVAHALQVPDGEVLPDVAVDGDRVSKRAMKHAYRSLN